MPFNHIQKGVLEEVFNAFAGSMEAVDAATCQNLTSGFKSDEVGVAEPQFVGTSAKGLNWPGFLKQLEAVLPPSPSTIHNDKVVDSILGRAVRFVFSVGGQSGWLDPKKRIPLGEIREPLEPLTGSVTHSIMQRLWDKASEGSPDSENPSITMDSFVHFLRELRKKAMFTKPTILCDAIRTLRAKHGLPVNPALPDGGAGSPRVNRKPVAVPNFETQEMDSQPSISDISVIGDGESESTAEFGVGDQSSTARAAGTEKPLVGKLKPANFEPGGLRVSESAPHFLGAPSNGDNGRPKSPGPHMLRRTASTLKRADTDNVAEPAVVSSSSSSPFGQTVNRRAPPPPQPGKVKMPGAGPLQLAVPTAAPVGLVGQEVSSREASVEHGVQTEDPETERVTIETQTSRPPTPPQTRSALPGLASSITGHSTQETQRQEEEDLPLSKDQMYQALSIVEGQNKLLLQLRKQLYDASIARIEAQENKLVYGNSKGPLEGDPVIEEDSAEGEENEVNHMALKKSIPAPYTSSPELERIPTVLSNAGIPPSTAMTPTTSRIGEPLSQVRIRDSQQEAKMSPPQQQQQQPGYLTSEGRSLSGGESLLLHKAAEYQGPYGNHRLQNELNRYESVLSQWEREIEGKEEAARRLLELRKREAMVKLQASSEESARMDLSRPSYTNVILGAKEFAESTIPTIDPGMAMALAEGDFDHESMVGGSTYAGGGASVFGGATAVTTSGSQRRTKQWGSGQTGANPAPSVIKLDSAAARAKKEQLQKEAEAIRETQRKKQQEKSKRATNASRRELITPTAVERSLYPKDTPGPRNMAMHHADSVLSPYATYSRTVPSHDQRHHGGDGSSVSATYISRNELQSTFAEQKDAQLLHVLGHQWHPSFSA